MAMPQTYQEETTEEPQKEKRLYVAIWRWHFYAGIIFAPFLILLAITGGIYLYKPQLEAWMYKDLYYVTAGNTAVSPTMQVEAVRQAYPEAVITRYRPSDEPTRTAEVGIVENKVSKTVFVSPFDGKIVGELDDQSKLMQVMKKLHGELMAGKTGDRIIELSACWGMILLVTGVYLWWPRNTKSLYGTLIPRFTQGKRIFWRDLHAVPAFWLSLFTAVLIMTGLPWSGVWGDYVNKAATSAQSGYPDQLWGSVPESVIPTKAVAEVSWAAENMPVPESAQTGGVQTLPLEQVVNIATERKVPAGYTINLPEGEKGVYTVSVFPKSPVDNATLHIDQYSGKVLADLRFADYGTMAKAIEIGIALHEGRFFGWPNQLLAALTCLGLVGISLTGLIMWWKRKPAGKLGAPALPKNYKLMKGVAAIIIAFGLFFPLVGISLVAVLLVDLLVIRRIPAAKRFLGA